FRHADLRGANLAGAKLDATDLRDANLRYAKVGEVDLREALVTPEQFKGLCFNSSTVFARGTRPARLASQCGGGGNGTGTGPVSCRQARDLPPARCDRSVIPRIIAPASGYRVECLRACDPYYVDRDSRPTLATIPPELEGGAWIKTTNTGDKHETAADFLQFEIDPPAMVYVAYDSRIANSTRRSPPRWLVDGFEPTGLVVGLNEPDPDQDFVVYRRRFDASPVVLGGNEAAGADFGGLGGSNYLVVVKRVGAA